MEETNNKGRKQKEKKAIDVAKILPSGFEKYNIRHNTDKKRRKIKS
ncbi:MAG: hypothetical protein ACTH8P_02915 [Ewingella sp.]